MKKSIYREKNMINHKYISHPISIHVSACGPKIVKVRGNPNEKYKSDTKGVIKGDDSVCV